MGIKKIKQVICDNCNCAIDYLNIDTPDSEIKWCYNRIIKNGGAIVEKKGLIFCNEECKKEYKKIYGNK